MKNFLVIIIYCLSSLLLPAKDHKPKDEGNLSDIDYYKSGVKLYELGEFEKSFIVFFNLC